MLRVNSAADGYSGNWVRVCDTCEGNDSTYVCSSCFERIHAASSMALPQECEWVFTENAAVEPVGSQADAASLCVNSLPGHIPTPSVSSLAYANSCGYPEELPGGVLDSADEENDEDQTDSWLLLEPEESSENQTKGGLTYKEPDKSDFNSCTDLRYEDQKNQQQLQYSCHGDSGSDGIVPVQSIELKEQGHWQHQHDFYFDRMYEASKAAFINTPSSQRAPMSFFNAGIVPNTTISDIPSSYTRYPNGITDFFSKFSLLMPLQFTPMNREAKVLRYREKRKARRFGKKIRYASRKAYAEARPRVKGRFVRKTDMDFEVGEMFSTEDYGYGFVPSY